MKAIEPKPRGNAISSQMSWLAMMFEWFWKQWAGTENCSQSTRGFCYKLCTCCKWLLSSCTPTDTAAGLGISILPFFSVCECVFFLSVEMAASPILHIKVYLRVMSSATAYVKKIVQSLLCLQRELHVI